MSTEQVAHIIETIDGKKKPPSGLTSMISLLSE
jgi:hypothetical protein